MRWLHVDMTALDADSKLNVSYLVGGRDAEYAMWFMDDLRGRFANRVQLTSVGHRAYLEAVEGAFGADVDYAQLVKLYGPTITAPGRYSLAECTGAKKVRVTGSPTLGTYPRLMSSAKTSPCGCTCGASPT